MSVPDSQRPVDSLGSYDLLREIGHGSYSRVYEARDRRSGVMRAVKVFARPCAGDGFVREAGVGFDLRHPNLVTAHDVGYLTGGTRFVAYDFVAGGSLRSRLRFCPLSPAEARHVVLELARALTVLHRASFVHRDIKPENILLEHSGAFARVRLGDLGTSEAVGYSPALGDVGSPAYMAPEQIEGACGTRADVYALGVLAYELLAGQRPFLGDPAEVIRGHLERSPDFLLVPERVRAVLRLALEKKPESRIATPYEFALHFDQALAGDEEELTIDLGVAPAQGNGVIACDPVSGWRAQRWGDQVGLEGSGVPTGYVAFEGNGSAAVCASSLVRFAWRDERCAGVGIGPGASQWEAPLYGLPPAAGLRRFAGDAVVVGGAAPGLMVMGAEGSPVVRVSLPVPLGALVVTAEPTGEHIVGVDVQHQRILVVRAPFDGKPAAVFPMPHHLIRLGVRQGRAWVEDAEGRVFFPEIPAHGPVSLIPHNTKDVPTHKHVRRLL